MINYGSELGLIATYCFQGSLNEFKDNVMKTHRDDKVIRSRYEKAIEFIEFIKASYE